MDLKARRSIRWLTPLNRLFSYREPASIYTPKAEKWPGRASVATRMPLGSVVIAASSAGSFGEPLEDLGRHEEELGINLQDFQLVILRRKIFGEYEVKPGIFSAVIETTKGILKVLNGAFCGC